MTPAITPKQTDFIKSLANERGMSLKAAAFLSSRPDRKAASQFIGSLLEIPVAQQPVAQTSTKGALFINSIPSGRYAAEDENGKLRFLKIDNVNVGKWSGYVFVKMLQSDNEIRQGVQRPNGSYSGKSVHALQAILKNPRAASEAYGLEVGRCGVCGRLLTDPESRALGIGPICAAKF